MTSKEDLKMIKIKCHPNANPNPMIDEALNNIEKDLEVLDILRKKLAVSEWVKIDLNDIDKHWYMLKDISFEAPQEDEDFNKIKEWLENEKNIY